MTFAPAIIIAVLAHNEAAHIASCLSSLPTDRSDIEVHVVVNGSSDATAANARSFCGAFVHVHDYREGGKARSWMRFSIDDRTRFADVHVFVDGDATLSPSTVDALVRTLAENPKANAVAALPLNGRKADAYRADLIRDRRLFGDCYAVRGSFLQRMKRSGIRLPDDLIGDDGLIGALAKTDLGPESAWDDTRIAVAPDAGFFMSAPAAITSPATWVMQYKRMVNYSVRHFQNQIISSIMRGSGPTALPRQLSDLYPDWLPTFSPRRSLRWWWFDRLALQRMRAGTRW